MAAARLTAIELLTQRQNEDWIRAWDKHGALRPDLTAQAIATASLKARDWLAQQDWSWCHAAHHFPMAQSEPYQGSADPDAAPPLNSHAPPSPPSTQPDRSDHLIAQPLVLLATSDSAQFLIWFSAITSLGYPLFLGNPAWGLKQWQEVQEGLAPHLIITDPDWSVPTQFPWSQWPVDNSTYLWEKQDFPQILTGCGKQIDPRDHKGLSRLSPRSGFPQAVEIPWIGIPTGGSSGQLRFALHSWKTLTASVSGLQQSELTDDTGVINSCCVLPLHHVSGLMQFMRSLLTGGQFFSLPWPLAKTYFCQREDSSISNKAKISTADSPFAYAGSQFFLSLVPTQLQQLLKTTAGAEWLVFFNTVFLGGAPAWPALLEQAKRTEIRLAPTYGMTETASQVITLHPDDFLRGQLGCGKLLPHAQVDWLSDSHPTTRHFPPKAPRTTDKLTSGILKIRAQSLALGYYTIKTLSQSVSHSVGCLELWAEAAGMNNAAGSFVTDDLGYCDPGGYFYIIGRASDKIISGGENIFPTTVESAILATGLVQDAVVIGLEDPKWGEKLVAVVALGPGLIDGPEAAPSTKPPSQRSSQPWQEQLLKATTPALSPAQRPKQWLLIDAIPRNAQGKIQRQELKDWAMQQVTQGNSKQVHPTQDKSKD